MALIKDYHENRFEITIPNCYWKIETDMGIMGGKNKIRVRMNCFKTKEIADTNENKYCDFDFEFTPNLSEDSPNLLAQAYAYAKTLPEFIGAVDA